MNENCMMHLANMFDISSTWTVTIGASESLRSSLCSLFIIPVEHVKLLSSKNNPTKIPIQEMYHFFFYPSFLVGGFNPFETY